MMRSTIAYLRNSLYVVWTIASKDIVDVLKNSKTRVNVIVLVGIVAFFYWASSVRSFDKRIQVAVYDQRIGVPVLESAPLADGFSLVFYQASSIPDMERKMGNKELGLVIPPDFDQILTSGGEPKLPGYVVWADRGEAARLELKFSQKFTELLNRPVRISIGDNFVIPAPDVETSDVYFQILFATLWMAMMVVPNLMLEEKQTKTMDALLVSPASPGEVVFGKALAGLVYVLLAGGLFFALNWAQVVSWGLALLAFGCCALFAIGLALLLGSFVASPKQLSLWMMPVNLLLVVPAFFAQEPLLNKTLKSVLPWLPTSALVRIFHLSLSSHAPRGQLLTSVAVALGGTALAFAVVVWKVRQSDRR